MQTHTLDITQPVMPQIARCLFDSTIDLSDTLCLLPNDFLAEPIRHALKKKHATLLPRFEVLSNIAELAYPDCTILASHQCQLLLAQLLKKHRNLCGKGSAWGLANNLLILFNELTLQGLSSSISWEDFQETLKQKNKDNHIWFNREAQLIHTLWRAWHSQMRSDGWRDQATAYTNSLQTLTSKRLDVQRVVLLVLHPLKQSEILWLEQLSKSIAVDIIDLKNTDHNKAGKTELLPCASSEEQALAIALSIKDAIERGEHPIVIGDDRRLTRRIHALLSRFKIQADDKAGWTLSTTTLGAVIEHCLQCVENDFSYQSLLDLLKSPLVLRKQQNKTLLLFRLEQDIIHNENIGSALKNYKQAIQSRHKRLTNHCPQDNDKNQQLIELLETLNLATKSLKNLQLSKRSHSPTAYLFSLQEALTTLGIMEALQEDAAGQQLLRLFHELENTDENITGLLHWHDFRQWLSQSLEGSYFRPNVTRPQVTLLNYQQAKYIDAEYCIIYSADENNLPPSAPKSPFFNELTRTSLGIENKQAFIERHHHIFKRLCNAETTIISWQTEQDGEPIEAAAWLQEHQQRHHCKTNHERLMQSRALLNSKIISHYEAAKTPANTIIKNTFSPSSHQRLINCPYHYFASDLLGLKPIDEIREALEKSDYGSRVHRCLEAFQRNIEYLPGPFPEQLNKHNQEAATQLLISIGEAVFTQDTESRFEHKSWLKRWQALILFYLKWETHRQQSYRPIAFEQNINEHLSKSLHIKGRLDRMDESLESQRISLLDYKTGYTPALSDLQQGEDVQLVSYAFALQAAKNIEHLAYIQLQDKKPVSERSALSAEDLRAVTDGSKARLENMQQALVNGHTLPAWGQQAACEQCDNAGICRREIWS